MKLKDFLGSYKDMMNFSLFFRWNIFSKTCCSNKDVEAYVGSYLERHNLSWMNQNNEEGQSHEGESQHDQHPY